MKRLAFLGGAAGAYLLVAWLTVPGFFDGLAPPAPYRWIHPPRDFQKDNQPPQSGQATIRVVNGVAQAGHVSTPDAQAGITFPAKSFEGPPGGAPVTLRIEPVASHPDLGDIVAAANVYLVSASTRLLGPVAISLRFVSLRQEPPGEIFAAETASAPWKSIGPIDSSVPFSLKATTTTLGYFVVGYRPAAPTTSAPAIFGMGGGQTLLVLVVAAAAIVVLASVPLVIARRRAPRVEQEAAAPARPARNLGGASRRKRRRRRR